MAWCFPDYIYTHILTRKYELCYVRDCNHPPNQIDTTELLLTSREWALMQIVK